MAFSSAGCTSRGSGEARSRLERCKIERLMRKRITSVLAAFCAACTVLAAQNAPALQQFVVLQSQTMIVPFETLTGEQAMCSISGNGNFATMRCQTPPGTAKASYHYVAMLIVDEQGMAYGIACHQSLVDLWCKKMSAGAAIQGSLGSGQKSLSIVDGQKSHTYQILTSALVGALQPGQLPPGAKPKAAKRVAEAPAAATPPEPTPAPSPAAPAPSARRTNGEPAATDTKTTGIAPASCMPATDSCTAFASEPQGADIYIDGKFVGNTPSTLALAPGSHEIRIQAEKFKPWTRTLESTAGSSVTIRATLAKK